MCFFMFSMQLKIYYAFYCMLELLAEKKNLEAQNFYVIIKSFV